jgi:predicted RNA-binding protein with PUA-like domain
MKYFLVKADPETDYGIDDLARDIYQDWDGVHNFQAIAFIKAMKPGDRVLIYHSQKEKSIVGEAEVDAEPYLNTKDPRTSWAVKIKFVRKYDTPVTLSQIKAEPGLKDFLLIRNGRLSVMEVPQNVVEWLTPLLGL